MRIIELFQGDYSPIRSDKTTLVIDKDFIRSFQKENLIEEKNNKYIINKSPFNIKRLSKLYGTKVRAQKIFKRNSIWGGIEFRKFFVFEFIKTCQAVKKNPSKYYGNIEVIDACLDYFIGTNGDLIHEHDIDRKHIKEVFNVDILNHQEEIIKKYISFKYIHKHRGMLMHAAAGTGKALVNGTPVRILDGWKKIEDLKVGDKVIGDDGKETNVIGVHPQGKRNCFKITFTDGRTIVADENHLWKVFKRNRSVSLDHEANWKIVDTKYMYQYFIKRGFNHSSDRFYIPLPEPEIKPDKDYIIDPYILGCILGDSGISINGIAITTSSLEVIKRIEKKLHHDIKLKYSKYPTANCYKVTLSGKTSYNNNVYLNELRRLNLYGTLSYNKFIPEEYLNGSTEQRWELLRGLMDSDGTVSDPNKTIGRTGKTSKCGNISYSTSSHDLCLNVLELIRSLGGMAKYYIKIPYYTYLGERKQGKDNYVINVRLKHPNMAFTRSDRKSRLTYENQYTRGFKLLIRSIDYVGKHETTCISVDNESKLFVAKDYIVTHNTLSSLFIMEGFYQEIDNVIIVCPLPTVHDVWIKTLSAQGAGFKKEQSFWFVNSNREYQGQKYIICHYEGLDKLINIIKLLPVHRTGIIIDESHNLNDPKSKRAQYTKTLVDKLESKNVLLLSGTPLKSGFKEMGLFFKLLDDNFDTITEKLYMDLYRSTTDFLNNVLRERYDGYTIKVEKSAIKLDPLVTVNLKIDIPEKELAPYYLDNIRTELRTYINKRLEELKSEEVYWVKEYLELREIAYNNARSSIIDKDWITYKNNVETIRRTNNISFGILGQMIEDVNKFENNILMPGLPTSAEKKRFKEAKTIYKYKYLKVQGEALANVVGKARINCHILLAEYLDFASIINSTNKKTIIFSNYIEVCKAVVNICKRLGYEPISVYGEETKNLAENVKKFENSKNINPLVTTYKSLSTGVPLTMADRIICIDMPFRMYIYEQAMARAWRLGQDSQVTSYIVEINTEVPNINSRTIDIITWYKEEVERITGIPSSVDITSGLMGSPEVNVSMEEFNLNLEYASHNYNITTELGLSNYDSQIISFKDEETNVSISTEVAKSSKRKKVEDLIISYIGRIVTGKENVELYKTLFNSMSDGEFDQFMTDLRDGKKNLSVIIPNGNKNISVDIDNNIKIAKELGFEFFQRLVITNHPDLPDHMTPNKYLMLKLPARRAAQMVSKKISIPSDNKSIDLLTGQVTGKSKGSKITNPELQVLLGLGLKDSVIELMKMRGGDVGEASAMNNLLYKQGLVTQSQTAEYSTSVSSKKTLKSYFNGMGIRSTL